MANSLLVSSTSSWRCTKACKFDGRDRLAWTTLQVNLGTVELFWFSIAFYVPVLYSWVVLCDISTNTANWSLHERNSWRISSKFLKKYQQILCWLQPRPRHVVPEIGNLFVIKKAKGCFRKTLSALHNFCFQILYIPFLRGLATTNLALWWSIITSITAAVAITTSISSPISPNTLTINPYLTFSHALHVQS